MPSLLFRFVCPQLSAILGMSIQPHAAMKSQPSKYLSPAELTLIRESVNVRRLIAALGLRVAKETPAGEVWVHSPFSTDKTASMHIQSDGKWYCHATGQGGGVIELYQAMRGGDCYAAGRKLRDLGVCDGTPGRPGGNVAEKERERGGQNRKTSRQPSLIPFLQPHPEFKRRGISERTRRALGCGFLPPESQSPLRGRLVFQIRDARGLVISHIGRAASPGQEPKWYFYAGFPKQDHLYNLDFIRRDPEARAIVASHGLPIVEGPFDVAKLDEAGVPAVAALGANLGPSQVEKLKALAGQVEGLRLLLWFDRDQAGQLGTQRAETLLQEAGLPYSVFDWNQTFPMAADHPASIPGDVKDACDFDLCQLRWLRRQGLI